MAVAVTAYRTRFAGYSAYAYERLDGERHLRVARDRGDHALYLEIASIILLVAAQVIAELQASAAAGLPWSERPPGRDGTDARGFLPPGPER